MNERSKTRRTLPAAALSWVSDCGLRSVAERGEAIYRFCSVTAGRQALPESLKTVSRQNLPNVLQTLIEGLAFVKSPMHKSAVVKTIMERLKINDSAVAEQGYRYLQRDLDVTLYPPVEG